MENVSGFLPLIAWIFAGSSVLLTSFLGAILAYHWFRYAMNPSATVSALFIYGAVSFTLLSGMLAALIGVSARVW